MFSIAITIILISEYAQINCTKSQINSNFKNLMQMFNNESEVIKENLTSSELSKNVASPPDLYSKHPSENDAEFDEYTSVTKEDVLTELRRANSSFQENTALKMMIPIISKTKVESINVLRPSMSVANERTSTEVAIENVTETIEVSEHTAAMSINKTLIAKVENFLKTNLTSLEIADVASINKLAPSSFDEDILTAPTVLSRGADADADLQTGQKIQLQRSNLDSDNDMNNPIGIEILKNASLVCGSYHGKRISFANYTTLMELPWTVLLLYNTKERYHCGGSLITPKYVLSAAHCVAQEFYELTGVRLGEYDVTKHPDCAPDIIGSEICATTIDVNVVQIIIHHGYSHLSFKNDIALLRLDQEYNSRSFYPICIPSPDKSYTKSFATVAGWGATENEIRSNILRKADVPILDMSKCRVVYRYSKFNDTKEICGSGANEVDVCHGDSGGAIFYEEYNGKDIYFQLGIISLGVRRCGDSRFLPAVFTKLKGFYKWIENNLEY